MKKFILGFFISTCMTVLIPYAAKAEGIISYQILDLDKKLVVKTINAKQTEWKLNRADLPKNMAITIAATPDITMVRTQLLDSSKSKKREDGTNYQFDDKKVPFSLGTEKGGDFVPLVLKKDEYSLRVYAYDGAKQIETKSINISFTDAPPPPPQASLGPLRIYPNAASFPGSDATGGRGGAICKVTTLADSGPGTLRSCVTRPEPTNVVFEVGGTIKLKSPLVLGSDLTIFGQTAPSPGITLYGNTLRAGGHNALIQHIRIRLGDKSGQRDAVEMTYYSDKKNGVYTCNKPAIENIVFDHVSISWAIDGSFDMQPLGCSGKIANIALTNSFVSEHLNNSVHGEGAHSFASLVAHYSRNITFMNNMFAHNRARNPRIDSNVTANVINNFIYDAGWHGVEIRNASRMGEIPTTVNIVNNLISMPASVVKIPPLVQVQSRPGFVNKSVYLKGNMGLGTAGKLLSITRANNVPKDEANLTEADIVATSPVLSLPSGIMPAGLDLRDKILSQSGARPFDRDMIDARLLGEIVSLGGSIIDRPRSDEVAYLEKTALDMNASKKAFPDIEKPSADDNGNGWTNLEEYIYKNYK